MCGLLKHQLWEVAGREGGRDSRTWALQFLPDLWPLPPVTSSPVSCITLTASVYTFVTWCDDPVFQSGYEDCNMLLGLSGWPEVGVNGAFFLWLHFCLPSRPRGSSRRSAPAPGGGGRKNRVRLDGASQQLVASIMSPTCLLRPNHREDHSLPTHVVWQVHGGSFARTAERASGSHCCPSFCRGPKVSHPKKKAASPAVPHGACRLLWSPFLFTVRTSLLSSSLKQLGP